jgi:hypothetical protein
MLNNIFGHTVTHRSVSFRDVYPPLGAVLRVTCKRAFSKNAAHFCAGILKRVLESSIALEVILDSVV